MLELLTIQIDTLLESLTHLSLLDARRAINRDLRFEPRAEELQTIVNFAILRTDDDHPRRWMVVNEGFQLMIVVDEYGDPAAVWNHKAGTGVMNPSSDAGAKDHP